MNSSSSDSLPAKAQGSEQLLRAATALRQQLLPAYRDRFGCEAPSIPSCGQCAVTALIVNAELGGQLMSTVVNGQSHWFNRITLRCGTYDLDLTGDQFGLPPIQCTFQGELYKAARVRMQTEVFAETFLRAIQLARRAALPTATAQLEREYRHAA